MKETAKQRFPSQDEYQEQYRQAFGGIVDKYLISHEENGNDMLIIYVDAENDVDWIDKRQNHTPADQEKLQECLVRLDAAQTAPTTNLQDATILRFKIMLGAGYYAALHDNYDIVQPVIDRAQKFIDERNKESSRFMLLSSSTIATLIAVIMVLISIHSLTLSYIQWVLGALMGILGSYVSIWSRVGKIDFTGYSSSLSHYLEAFARLFCGSIFALIGILLMKSGLVLNILSEINVLYSGCIVGFIAGFNERFIPSLIQRMAEEGDDK